MNRKDLEKELKKPDKAKLIDIITKLDEEKSRLGEEKKILSRLIDFVKK